MTVSNKKPVKKGVPPKGQVIGVLNFETHLKKMDH
jgi:hypothetical protein